MAEPIPPGFRGAAARNGNGVLKTCSPKIKGKDCQLIHVITQLYGQFYSANPVSGQFAADPAWVFYQPEKKQGI